MKWSWIHESFYNNGFEGNIIGKGYVNTLNEVTHLLT